LEIRVILLIDNKLNKNAACIPKVACNPVLVKIIHLFIYGKENDKRKIGNKVQVLILI
jgi:hypothetical protein